MSIDLRWLAPGIIITWYLAQKIFPVFYKDLSAPTYWMMGAVGVLVLLSSLIMHELSHCLIAKRLGLSIKGASILLFGGVAEIDREPSEAKIELSIAVAGPLCSMVLGLIFYSGHILTEKYDWSASLDGLLFFGWIINGVIAGFNLLPAFPLDGGRIVRSILWLRKNDIDSATALTCKIGATFGIVFLVLGLLSMFTARFIAAAGCLTTALFLMDVSRKSYHSIPDNRLERYIIKEVEEYRQGIKDKTSL